MSRERARWRAAGIAVLGFAVFAFAVGINPANLPVPWIERWLQAKLPYGSSIVVVRHAIEDEKWKTVSEWVSDTGSLVLVHIGNAWFPPRYVYASFGFDRYGQLVSLDVQKDVSDRTARSR